MKHTLSGTYYEIKNKCLKSKIHSAYSNVDINLHIVVMSVNKILEKKHNFKFYFLILF